ncbi:MAG: hypothetical protein ACJ8KX_03120 [Chthoniobacterales bacterium]
MRCRELLQKYGYVIGLVAITCAIAIGWFLLDGNVGFNLADEGYLWYGTEALLRGEVPMRDFEAYDPGRYVWTAAWSFIVGHGMVPLRLSCVFFGCLGVIAGLLAVRRVSRNWFFLGAVALLLSLWMQPRYKAFEQSIALMAVYAGVLLLERPSLRRHFALGVFGGICAFFGRNHGLYHVVAFGLLITYSAWASGFRGWIRRCVTWGSGIFVGYLPQLLMFAFVPRFFRAYLPYVQSTLAKGTTNLTRPVPWPWLVATDAPVYMRAAGIAEGLFFIAFIVLVFPVAFRLWHLRRRSAPAHLLLLAAFCVAIPYAHYVFSRADIVHLSHGVPPMLVGAIALLFTFANSARWVAWAVIPALTITSLCAQVSQTGMAFEYLAPDKSLHTVKVNDRKIVVSDYQARLLASAHYVADGLARPNEAIFFAPHTPGLYPFVGRRSPTKQIYFVFPATPEADQSLVSELQAADVQWALVGDSALDGRDELRFRNTNPILCAYLRNNFAVVPLATLPRHAVLLHRRDTSKS